MPLYFFLMCYIYLKFYLQNIMINPAVGNRNKPCIILDMHAAS